MKLPTASALSNNLCESIQNDGESTILGARGLDNYPDKTPGRRNPEASGLRWLADAETGGPSEPVYYLIGKAPDQAGCYKKAPPFVKSTVDPPFSAQ